MKKSFSRFGIATLTAVFVASTLVATPAQAAGCDVSSFAGGAGTEVSPFQVATAQQLTNLSACRFDGKHFVMTTNISVASFSPWESISYFIGTFDGAGYEITNLNLSSAESNGLFGYVEDSVIRNLKLRGTANVNSEVITFGVVAGSLFRTTIQDIEVNVDITVPEDVTLAGGVAGYTDYTNFSDISVSANTSAFKTISGSGEFGGVVGNFNNGSITRAEFVGDIEGSVGNDQIGGIAGNASDAVLNDLTVTGDITSSGAFTAGVVGYLSEASLTKATHTGDVINTATFENNNVGGIAGFGAASDIVDVTQVGDVSGKDTLGMSSVGGIVSYLANSMNVNSSLTDATVTGDVSGVNNAGGIVGYIGDKSPVSNVSMTGNVQGTQFVGGIAGYQTSTISDAVYAGDVTATSNAGGISGYCAGSFGYVENVGFVTTPSAVTNVVVTSNVTTSDGDPTDFTWNPTGTIIGYSSSCNVTNAVTTGTVTGESFIGGAIGYGSESTLSEIKVNVTVTSTGEGVGGLVGYAAELILNDISVTGNVTGKSDFFGPVGGIAGNASNIIANRITYSGNVDGIKNVGGFFGNASNVTVTDSYMTGTIKHDPLEQYSAAGLIAGNTDGVTLTRVYVSGSGADSYDLDILGMGEGVFNSVIQDSTADGTVGQYSAVLLKTAGEMKLAKTYRDQLWDFSTVWMMNAPANNGMPMLRSLSVPSDCKVRNFSPVLFQKGSAKLSTKAKTNLTKFANQIAFGPCRNLKITGYTSTYELGKKLTPVKKLKKLAAARAQSVKKHLNSRLTALGDSFTVTVSIRHKLSPIASNKKLAGQAKNRRVVAATLS